MATIYTSTQSGDWNDINTWGGGGFPNVDGDSAVVSAGHTVIYNGVYATLLAGVEIKATGVLRFTHTTNTEIHFGPATTGFIVRGELQFGTAVNPIPAIYTSKVLFDGTGDFYALRYYLGSKVLMYDDPAYYGNDYKTYLTADWTVGSIFTVHGDYTTKWQVGQRLNVIFNKTALLGLDGGYLCTIKTLTLNGSNTDVEINEAFPAPWVAYSGNLAYATVYNLSRNILWHLTAINWLLRAWTADVARVEGPQDYTTDQTGCYRFRGTFIGMYGLFSYTKDLDFDGVEGHTSQLGYYTYDSLIKGVLHHQWYGLNYCTNVQLDADQVAAYYTNNFFNFCTINGDSEQMSAPMGWNTAGIYDSVINGNINNCGSFYQFRNTIFNGCISGCYMALGQDIAIKDCKIRGSIGWDKFGNSKPSGSGDLIAYIPVQEHLLEGARLPLAGLSFYYRNWFSYGYNSNALKLRSANHNQVLGAHWCYYYNLDMIKNVSVTRAGHVSSIELVPLSSLNVRCKQKLFEWTELNIPATPQTRSIFVEGTGWSTFPTATELYLEAEYPSGSGVEDFSTIASVQVISVNSVWTELSVAFTPARVGVTRYRLYFGRYEAGAKIYADGCLNRAGLPGLECSWWGEPLLSFDYTANVEFNKRPVAIGGKHVIAVD